MKEKHVSDLDAITSLLTKECVVFSGLLYLPLPPHSLELLPLVRLLTQASPLQSSTSE